MHYQAILFDLDDTLYDLRSYWRGRLHEALSMLSGRYPRLDRDELVGRAIAEKVYIEKMPAFLRGLPIDDEALIGEIHTAFARDWFARLTLNEDAPATLAELRPHFRLGLVTNGPSRMQRPKIEQFRLDDYLDTLIVSEEVGVAKPDPAIFHLALEQLGTRPESTLYVGDSLEFDLPGAKAAGLPFIWMNPRRELLLAHLPAPVATIERLSELVGLLAQPLSAMGAIPPDA